MTRLSFPACCLIAIALFAPSAEASVVIVDDFDDTNATVSLTADSGTPSASLDQPTTAAIGNYRVTTAMWNSGQLTVTAKSNPPTGQMAFSSESGTDGTFELFYDANGNGLNADVTDGGLNSFLFVDFISADMGADLTITLKDSTNTATLTESLAGGPGLVAFKLIDFVGVDLTNLESILVNIEGEPDGDYTIDSIYAGVPEPSTIAIWSLFGVGMAFYARRQRKS